MTPEQIAKELNYAEVAAVRGIFAWATLWEQEDGEAKLYRLGIWNPKPKHRASKLTPLGLEVRAILEANNERG